MKALVASAIIALSLFAGWSFYEKGKLAERNKRWALDYAVLTRRADSLAGVTRKADTVLVESIKTVTRHLSQPVLRVDTVRVDSLVRDTVWVREYVRESQTALAACSVLARDCETFRTEASARFAADSVRVAELESKPEKSTAKAATTAAGIGTAVGLILGLLLK